MTRAAIAAVAAALVAGCASTPGTTARTEPDCQVASAEGTNVVSNGRQRPQSEMAQRFARADMARTGYRQEHMNDQPSATEEAVRNCINR